MKVGIPLSNGMHVFVDLCDWKAIAAFRWYAACDRGIWYAKSTNGSGDAKRTISMHRFLFGFPCGIVDHRDRDGLNNSRSNLRLTNRSGNGANAVRHKDSSSPHKGVTFCKCTGKWRAQLCVSGVRFRSRRFVDPADAAKAYDRMAVLHFGKFARTNFDG